MRVALLVAALSISCGGAIAAVFVDASSTGEVHNGRSWSTAYLTINDALNSMPIGGDVWIRGGVYRERLTLKKYHNLYGGFAGKELYLSQRTLGNPPTVIDAQRVGRAIDVAGNARCVIDALVIVNGTGDRGGGIRCQTNSVVKVRNCRIENCRATEYGGGFYLGTYAQGEVTGCFIARNLAPRGGGAVVEYHSYPILKHNVFAWNGAVEGGALYCPFHSGAYLEYCTLAFNLANATGGAVYAYEGGPVTLKSCILAFNSAKAGGGLYGGGLSSATSFSRCAFFANAGGDWAGRIRPQPAYAANFTADPMFVSPMSGDFRLAAGSGCKGVGAFP